MPSLHSSSHTGTTARSATTNFDDLIADALYLFTRTKPVVVTHDSLARFVDAGRKRPNVIKLHGDAMFEPKNTDEETARLGPETQQSLEAALKNRTLIINGYVGNDRSITELFGSPDHDFFASGAYWVTDEIPETAFGHWFQSCPHAIWVPHRDFDQLILLIRDAFGLPHPEEKRFRNLLNDYNESFSKLSGSVDALPDESGSKLQLVAAAEKAASQFTDWWSVELAARKHKRTDPDEADRIYREGIQQFPGSPELLGNYANFLANQRHDFDQTETCYQSAIEADPDNPKNLGNYGGFVLAGGDLSGFDLLRCCKDPHPDPGSLSEVHLYEYAHGTGAQRVRALAGLKPLIADGVRSPGWRFARNIERAKKDDHPNLPLLQALADVINDKADPTTLDDFEDWKNVGSPDQNDGAEDGIDG